MRLILTLFTALSFITCVKQPSKNPIPQVEFDDFAGAGKSRTTNSDTATMILSYEDGDGDLFVDNFSEGPNLIFTTYEYDKPTGSFVAPFNLEIQDTVRYTNTIKQPDNGYYKGKAIRGQIFVPLTEFRQNDDVKILKFSGFLLDKKGNKSNMFTSPVFTLNF
jgi:hypothetical protein